MPGNRRLCARVAWRQRHPAREPHRTIRGRCRGDLFLREHYRDEHPDRRQVDHGPECIRLTRGEITGFASIALPFASATARLAELSAFGDDFLQIAYALE